MSNFDDGIVSRSSQEQCDSNRICYNVVPFECDRRVKSCTKIKMTLYCYKRFEFIQTSSRASARLNKGQTSILQQTL